MDILKRCYVNLLARSFSFYNTLILLWDDWTSYHLILCNHLVYADNHPVAAYLTGTHKQNFRRIKFTPKNANFCQFFARGARDKYEVCIGNVAPKCLVTVIAV